MDAESLSEIEGTPHQRIAAREQFDRFVDALTEAAKLEILTRYAEQRSGNISDSIKAEFTILANREQPMNSDLIDSLIDRVRISMSDEEFAQLIAGTDNLEESHD
jgi:hypothetical protein